MTLLLMEWIMERVCAAHVGSGLLLGLNKNRFYHSKELFESCQILNVYKLNRRNTAIFMHIIKNRTLSLLKKNDQPAHLYPICFSSGNYRKPQIISSTCRFWISIRGPAIWNKLVRSTEKEIQLPCLFKTKIKINLLFLKMMSPFSNAFAFTKLNRRSINWWEKRIMSIVYSIYSY